jgi:hypothetical protein
VPGAPAGRLRARWTDLLRNAEIRIVSGPADAPYAVTVLYLSGQVIVQLEERFWRETPGPLRDASIRAHVEQVRAAFQAMGSPAVLAGTVVRAVRGLWTAASGAPVLVQWITQGTMAAATLTPFGVLAAAAWLVPRPWIERAIRPLVRAWLRRMLSRSVHRLQGAPFRTAFLTRSQRGQRQDQNR